MQVRHLFGQTKLLNFSSSLNDIKETTDVETMILNYNNYDDRLNRAFQNMMADIDNISKEDEEFELNIHYALTAFENFSKFCESKEHRYRMHMYILYASSVFIVEMHQKSIEKEITIILEDTQLCNYAAQQCKVISMYTIPAILKKSILEVLSEIYTELQLVHLLAELEKLCAHYKKAAHLWHNNTDNTGRLERVKTYIGHFFKTDHSEDMINILNNDFKALSKRDSERCTYNSIHAFACVIVRKFAHGTTENLKKNVIDTLLIAFEYSLELFKNSFTVVLKEHITDINYATKHAEPLSYPTLDNKRQFFLQCIKRKQHGNNELEEHFAIENLTKITSLPRDVKLIQTLDMELLKLLPILSLKDAGEIHYKMNTKKQTILDKIKKMPTISDGAISKWLAEIINDSQNELFTIEVKSAAIIDLGAWLIPICALIQYTYEQSKNVANAIEREKNMLQTRFRSLCSEHKDKVNAAAFVDIIENTIYGGINYKICLSLVKEMNSKHEIFVNKSLFVGTVLRDLCIKDDYQGIMQFIRNFEEFSKRWILDYVCKACIKSDGLFLNNIATMCTNHLLQGSYNAFAALKGMSGALDNLENWTEKYLTCFKSNTGLTCNENAINKFMQYFNVHNFELFTRECTNQLNAREIHVINEILKMLPSYSQSKEDDVKKWLLRMPKTHAHIQLFESIGGCGKQCPFCGVVCDHSLSTHEKHQAMLHFPSGVKGNHWKETNRLNTTICTYAVMSTIRYKTKEHVKEPEYRPYKDYEVDYPSWYIRGEPGEHTNDFWKYIFAKFNALFAKLHRYKKAKLPDMWLAVTKEDAIKSVTQVYKLQHEKQLSD